MLSETSSVYEKTTDRYPVNAKIQLNSTFIGLNHHIHSLLTFLNDYLIITILVLCIRSLQKVI